MNFWAARAVRLPMPASRTVLHLLLALAVMAQGVLPALAASRECAHGDRPSAAAQDRAELPCHGEHVAPATGGDEADRDCCSSKSCDCACVLIPGLPGMVVVSARIDPPPAPESRNSDMPAPTARAPANPPPIG